MKESELLLLDIQEAPVCLCSPPHKVRTEQADQEA